MVKLSVSIPDDIYQAILNTIPEGTPFSQGLTALIRKALGLPEDPKVPIVVSNTSSITAVTPEIQNYILKIVRTEILRMNLVSNSTVDNYSGIENPKESSIQIEEIILNEIPNPDSEPIFKNNEESSHENISPLPIPVIETEATEWITQSDIVKMLPESILLITRKSKVSKAAASGKMITNGLAKTECRILRSSALKWVSEVIG